MIRVRFSPGVVGNAKGLSKVISTSIAGGDATSFLAAGFALNVAASYADNGARAHPSGLTKIIALSISAETTFVGYPLPGLAVQVAASIIGGSANASSADPDFSSVVLLLPMDGTNGSTTITDSSSNALSATVYGNAQISTSGPKFGSGSLLLDGTGDYITLPDDPDWDFGTGDFTVEAWIHMAALNNNSSVVVRLNPAASAAWGLRVVTSPTRLQFYAGGSSFLYNWTGGSLNTWHHVAATRSGTTLSVYANGTRLGSGSNSANLGTSTAVVRVGTDSLTTDFFNGNIDDVRITKGVARYTGASYTVPTEAHPTS